MCSLADDFVLVDEAEPFRIDRRQIGQQLAQCDQTGDFRHGMLVGQSQATVFIRRSCTNDEVLVDDLGHDA